VNRFTKPATANAKSTGKVNPQPLAAASVPHALLNIQTVAAVTGISHPTIYRKVAAKQFPEPVRLGTRCTRWRSADVMEWIAAKAPSDGAGAPTKHAVATL